MRNKVSKLLQRLNLRGLSKIDPKMRLMGRREKGKWVLLVKFKGSQLIGWNFADLDGDGLLEFTLVLRQPEGFWVCIGKFVSGKWWVKKEKFPSDFVSYHSWGIDFRHHGIKWVLWQGENNHCVAVTVK